MVTIASITLCGNYGTVCVIYSAQASDTEVLYGEMVLPTRLHPVLRWNGVHTSRIATVGDIEYPRSALDTPVTLSMHGRSNVYHKCLYIDAGAAW